MQASGRNVLHLTGWNEASGIGYGLAFENFVSFHLSNQRWLEISRDPGDGSFTVTDHDFNEDFKEDLERCHDAAGLQIALVASVGASFETMQLEEICVYAGFLPGGPSNLALIEGVPHELGPVPIGAMATREPGSHQRLPAEQLKERWNRVIDEPRGDLYLSHWDETTRIGYGLADREIVQFQIGHRAWVSITRERDGSYMASKFVWSDVQGVDQGFNESKLGSHLTPDDLRLCLQAHLGTVFDEQQIEEIQTYSSFLSTPLVTYPSSRSRPEARNPEPEAESVTPAVPTSAQIGTPRRLMDLCVQAGLVVVGDRIHDNGCIYWAVNDDRPFVGGRYVVLVAESGVTLDDLRGLLWSVEDLDAIRGLAIADRFSAKARAFAWGRPIQLVEVAGGTEHAVPKSPAIRGLAQIRAEHELAIGPRSLAPEPLAVIDLTDQLLSSEVYAEQREAAGRHAPSDDMVRIFLAAARERGGRVPLDVLVRIFAEPEHAVLSKVPMLKRVLNVDSYDVLDQDPEDRSVTVDWELLRIQFEIE